MEKQKVYVETSVISNLTARPASNIADAARQLEEWKNRTRAAG